MAVSHQDNYLIINGGRGYEPPASIFLPYFLCILPVESEVFCNFAPIKNKYFKSTRIKSYGRFFWNCREKEL